MENPWERIKLRENALYSGETKEKGERRKKRMWAKTK